MPHECTACGRAFPDGSKEMLSGCPDCGGTKFQFHPTDGETDDAPAPDDAPDDADVTGREWPTYGDEPSDERRVRGQVGSRARGAAPSDDSPAGGDTTPPASDPSPADDDADIVVAEEQPLDREDTAQADARSGFVAPDEVAAGAPDDEDDAADETPDLSALRRELNDQFESIRIVSQGQYELNLMELYEREEHIISLREDGRYVIEVPETWRDG